MKAETDEGTQINDGGQAFPQVRTVNDDGQDVPISNVISFVKSFGGMTMRQYFAGQAIAGLTANSSYCDNASETASSNPLLFAKLIAVNATQIADAAIAELERTR